MCTITRGVGHKVKLKIECMGNPIGTIGVCYETYNIGEPGGMSYIFKNGEYCGFSAEEQKDFFEEVGFCHEVANYDFTNVMQLSRDFDNSFFNPAFKEDRSIKE